MAFTFSTQELAASLRVAQTNRSVKDKPLLQLAEKIAKKQKKQLTDFNNLMMLISDGMLSMEGKPSQALIALSDYLDLRHNQDLKSLCRAWDKFFIRNASGQPIERWEIASSGIGQVWENNRAQMLALLSATGLLKTRLPQNQHYDTLIIHGAYLEDIMPRFKLLTEFWNQGGRFDKIVFLTGERFLTAAEKDQNNWQFLPYKATYQKWVSTEIDLMQYAWLLSNQIPDEVRQLPISWINTPNFADNRGQIRRGITEDTVNAWLNEEFSGQQFNLGKCLAIANCPLVLRQHVVFERKIHERSVAGTIETIGLAETKPANQPIIYYLREIAGLLWELSKFKECL